MTEIQELWKSYNLIAKLLKDKLNRTSNLVGEYGEFLMMEYTSGELLTASHKSADIKASNGDFYQVKSRKLSNPVGSQLGVIRTWDFDYLAVVIFDDYGNISKALISPQSVAKQYGKRNEHQNGWIITTTKSFLEDKKNTDITLALKQINIEGFKLKKEPTNSTDTVNENEKLPIGVFVRVTFRELIENNRVDATEIEKLQKTDYSKSVFDIQYPFLRKVLISDEGKVSRYWKTPITISGNKYFMCSEWFESTANNDRPFYEKWLKQMKGK